MKRILRAINKRIKNEAGQAFIIVLLLLALGSLLIAPLLSYTGTGLQAGRVYDTKADEFYAADAGVEDALWIIRNDRLEYTFGDYTVSGGYDPYHYYDYDGAEWTYTMSEQLNGKDVTVEIKNMWVVKGIDAPEPDMARVIIQGLDKDNPPKLIITGNAPAGTNEFEINITFLPADGEEDDLLMQAIGIWLPPGFTYVEDSSWLDDPANSSEPYYSEPEVSQHAGGTAVIWRFSDIAFTEFPGVDADSIQKYKLTFEYTPEVEGSLPEGVSWLETTGVDDVSYAWDADVGVYRINSTAYSADTGTDTEIEAYSIKGEMRQLVSAISGDYYATGDAFLYAGGYLHNSKYRDTMYSYGEALVETTEELDPIAGIPEDAAIVGAYLYWTGWIDNDGYDDGGGGGIVVWSDDTSSYGTSTTIWSDDTSSYGTTTTLWTENCSSYYDTPSSWPFTWSNGSRWSNSSNRFWGSGGSGQSDRTLTSETIPLGGYTGQDVVLSVDISESGAEGSDILYYQFYNSGGWSGQQEIFNGDDSSGTYTIAIPEGYLTDDFQVSFYWYANYSNDNVYLDNIAISTFYGDWDPGANWTIYNNDQFRGQGGGSTDDRTLTRVTDIDLSAYTGQMVTISWQQSADDTGWGWGQELDSGDNLEIYISKNGGSSFELLETYYDDDINTTDPNLEIPSDYLVSNFRMMFIWTADENDEYCYIDDIDISTFYGDWDPGANWTIYNNDQFRGQGGGTTDDRTLTRVTSIDLSAYSGQTVELSAYISDNNAEGGDILYCEFYNASGWSGQQAIYEGDDSSGNYSVTIPEEYLTDQFLVRFYWNDTSSTEYVYIDDIDIIVSTGYTGLEYTDDPEDQVNLVENNARVNTVLFSSTDDNITQIYADNYEITEPVIINGYGVDEGEGTWSYCCYADVTSLVTQWIEDGDLDANGAGTYTVGSAWVGVANEVDPSYSWSFADGGSTGYPLGTPANTTSNLKDQNCHSGWSIILIYSSPETSGHQLYLYDINSPGFNYTQGRGSPTSPADLDFDGDGEDGGTIKGFLVPEPIAGETEAGRITVFIGEGDEGSHSEWGDDYLAVNGAKLWDGIDCLNNSVANPNDAWNSRSYGLNLDGVDIDTFKITWASSILEPSDIEASVDVVTEYDGIHIIYIILSFRSEVNVGGTMTYIIH